MKKKNTVFLFFSASYFNVNNIFVRTMNLLRIFVGVVKFKRPILMEESTNCVYVAVKN